MTEKRNFSFDEDFVIKQALRENLQELRSSRLHYAGPATDVELPQKPFGLVDISQQEKNVSYSNIDSKLQMTCLEINFYNFIPDNNGRSNSCWRRRCTDTA